jgi:hypothetical protein
MAGQVDKNRATSAAEAARIIPRAEFRVFGQGVIDLVGKKIWDAGAVLQKMRRMPPEIYFLSTQTDEANVKVRDGLLDIKTKGGQLWRGMKSSSRAVSFSFP